MSAKNLKNRALYHFRNQSVNEFSVVWGVGETEQGGPYLFIGRPEDRVGAPARRARQAGDGRDRSPRSYEPAGRKF